MKKLIVMLSLGVLVAGSSVAQQAPQKERKNRTEQRDGRRDKKERKSPEERATRRTEKMSKELGLNNSQTKKLQALHLKQAKEKVEIRAQYKHASKHNQEQHRGKEASRGKMKASREKWDAELQDILTKKQYAQYQEQREERRA